MLEDDTTLGDSTVVAMDANGCCTKHPHIQLRVKGEDGLIYQQESCPECDAEFRQERLSLKEKKAELDRQLQELERTSDGPTATTATASSAAVTSAAMKASGLTNGSAPGMPGMPGMATGAPSPYGMPPMPATTSMYPTMYGGMMGATPGAAPGMGGMDPTTAAPMDMFQQQMFRMQQMQDWMLQSKEREIVFLRQKLEDQQQQLVQKEVELALLREKLNNQEQRMQQELKLIKMAALGGGGGSSRVKGSNGSERGGSERGGDIEGGESAASGSRRSKKGREIHIQELHVSVSGNSGADGSTPAVDPEAVKAATAKATSAAISSAEEAAATNGDASQQQLGVLHVDLTNQNKSNTSATAATMATTSRSSNGSKDAAAAMATHGASADFSDDESSLPPIGTGSFTSGAYRKAKRYESAGENPASSLPSTNGDPPGGTGSETNDITFVPPTSADGDEEEEEDEHTSELEDKFDPAVPIPTRSGGGNNPYSAAKTQGPLTKANEKPLDNPNPSKRDPMRASSVSIQPPAHTAYATGNDMKNDAAVAAVVAESKGYLNPKTGLPTKAGLDAAPPAAMIRGTSIPKEFEFNHDHPDPFLSQEEVTLGTLDHQSLIGTVTDDTKSVGNTVASSTYGEDRQKVHSQTLLDPYGDKGKYSGIVLRSTGMPHGLGRMVYEDDGRTYEGDWRHGRWHGYGRATFANGDSYEGEYRFDQRHGRGIYCWNDGRVYDGAFSEDKRHGKGTFKWPDGATYEGDFVQGQREGHGRYTFSDGGYYVGSWVDGRYEGHGVCHWEDGRTYKGEWRAGMAHGMGVETYPDGRVRHDGQWSNDEPVRN